MSDAWRKVESTTPCVIDGQAAGIAAAGLRASTVFGG